ncbi:Nuclear pore complex protein Nup160 [Portunus trituberculatus]|uniref:Nuclear pore complex protein Nup160 n=1 Tax=Portunus trituberculatus TaxID=210409 RepID=A0A5B7H0N3_PORTR|nr:Nuclear pore complex protein Nup160 [Portunus trituberculatus]
MNFKEDIVDAFQLLYAAVEGGEDGQQEPPGLCSVVLEPMPEKEVPITDPFLDLREVYLRELFVPNRFSAHTLRKALGIYRRSIDLASLGDRGMARLQEEVEAALRDEVEARVTSALSEEEVMQVTHEVWATFYSHTLQYHQVGQKPVGVVGGVGVVRKQVVSWVRPVDVVEVMVLLPLEELQVGMLASVVGEDTASGLVSLARPLRLLHQALPPEQAAAFSLDLYHLQPPDCLAEALASSLLAHDPVLSAALTRHLTSLPGITSALWAYLHALQLDLGLPDALAQGDNGACPGGAVAGLLAGRAGAAVVGAVVGQVAHVRFQLCRELLVLQQAALQLPQSCLSVDASATIRSTLLPKTALLTQAYLALLHLATAPAERPAQATLETARRQLAVLTLGSGPSLPTQARPATVLELFFLGSGGDEARALAWPALEQVWCLAPGWATLVMPLAITLAQLAWPISRCLLLLEWMVWAGQHAAVQQYVRLLQPWCEWNSFSRKFLLGVSLLNQGEAGKAAQLLVGAMEGVLTEDFLGVRVAGGAPDTLPDQLRITYCLRVVRLLEQAGQPALALHVAQQGVAVAAPQEPALAALYSVVFKHELDLHHHDEAFTALLACPDPQRRRNCLRQLVVALHDRR